MNSSRYPDSHHRDKKAEREALRKSRHAEAAEDALERSMVRPDGTKAPVPAAVVGSGFGTHLRLYGDAIVVASSSRRNNEPPERPHFLSDLSELQWAFSRKGRCFIRTPPAGPEIHLDISLDPSTVHCTQDELREGLKTIHELYPSLPVRQMTVLGERLDLIGMGTSQSVIDRKVREALAFVPGFTPSNHITGTGSLALGLDSAQHKLCVIDVFTWTCRVYDAAHVLSVEVFEDGQSITRSHRHGKTGRGMVAVGLMVGDFATLAGGMAAGNAAKPRDLIHEVTIRLGINDPEKPLCDVPLFRSRSHPIKRGSSWYRSVSTDARSWVSLLTAMTSAADRAAAGADQAAGPPPVSVAAELGQLAQLFADGHLTDAEFAELKGRLIRG
jgi:hypothetical protein